MADPNDDQLDSTVLIGIVIGSTGLLLMILGAVYYLSRLGDIPRGAVASLSAEEVELEKEKTLPSATSAKSPESGKESDESDTPKEELFEIYAPAGKLGVILDTPGGEGPPVVHEIRPNSVLEDELKVGDRVIAIDDEDVRKMSANKVSKLISRKMDNSTRKFSIIRTILPDV